MICPICGNDCHVPPPARLPKAYKEIMVAQGFENLYFATCPEGRRIEREAIGYNIDTLIRWTEHFAAIEDAISGIMQQKKTVWQKLRDIFA